MQESKPKATLLPEDSGPSEEQTAVPQTNGSSPIGVPSASIFLCPTATQTRYPGTKCLHYLILFSLV